MLLDSNILIYCIQPQFTFLIEFIAQNHCFASEISKVEVLGYHKIKEDEIVMFRQIFDNLEMISIHAGIIEKAIDIRQKQSFSLGDSFIAATAIVCNLPLVTRNSSDFIKLESISNKSV